MACCGDVPTLEALAAASTLREHLPALKIWVVNVVDLLKLQRSPEHPHGLSEADHDALFTRDTPVVFAFHGYPWLVHVHGYREEGTIATAFDMAVLNELDRFHLVLDRVPNPGNKAACLRSCLN